jgi:hypothetical protein
MAAEVRARRALTLDESVPATEGIHDWGEVDGGGGEGTEALSWRAPRWRGVEGDGGSLPASLGEPRDGGEWAASEGLSQRAPRWWGGGRAGGDGKTTDRSILATDGRGRRRSEAYGLSRRSPGRRAGAATEGSAGWRGRRPRRAPGEGRISGVGRLQRGEKRRMRRRTWPARGEAVAAVGGFRPPELGEEGVGGRCGGSTSHLL